VELVVTNADGTVPAPSVAGITDSDSLSLGWSPDATHIVYAGGGDVRVVRADRAGAMTLATGTAPSWPPAFGAVPASTPPPPVSSSPSPVQTMAPTSEPTAEPAPSPTPTVPGYPAICEASKVTGHFEGGRAEDTAIVAHNNCPPAPGQEIARNWTIQVTYGSTGGGGAWDLPMCGDVCRAVAAADLNDDGVDEFILEVDPHDRSSTLQLLSLPLVETGPVTILVKHPTGGLAAPARFPIGESVEQQGFLTCDSSGDPLVISTVADLNADRTEYDVQETLMSVRTDEGSRTGYPIVQTLIIESTNSWTVPFDPNGTEIPVRGTPCWDES
jgi:hypothetical protein